MDKTQLWPILHSASFMVFPSECLEILGFSIIEAMLCNKAVIGSNIGAIPETIIDGQTGLLFEPGNVKMLAEKIQSLYKDEKLSNTMGMNAGNYIRELTHPEKYYEHLKKIIPVLN
jgi:glycosyltransferase involved in cell wall biosynthesis